jgi:hypothetical protein
VSSERPDSHDLPEHVRGVRLSWLLAAWSCIVGAGLIALGTWSISTAPGTLEVMDWEQTSSVQLGAALWAIGGFAILLGSITCVWLLVLGSYQLWRNSGYDRGGRIRELLWNALGTLIAVALVLVIATR